MIPSEDASVSVEREIFIELSPDAGAPARARRALNGLSENVPRRTLDDLRVVVSEVVTNVFLHAGLSKRGNEKITLRILQANGRIKCEICDPSGGFDPSKAPAPRKDLSGGWGLVLLDRLSESWRARHDGLFCISFEMRW